MSFTIGQVLFSVAVVGPFVVAAAAIAVALFSRFRPQSRAKALCYDAEAIHDA